MFWLGFAEGLNQQLDRNLQREIWLGKNNKETQERVHRARLGAIKSIVEGRAKEAEEYKNHVRVIKAFEERLEGVDSPEEREAYLNKLKEDPDYAAGLLESLIKFETDKKEGVRVEGNDLIEMVDLIDMTQPSELSREQYVDQVARAAVDMAAGIGYYDSLWEAVMAPDASEEELIKIQAEADSGWSPEGELGIPQPDYSGINVRPSTQKDVGSLLVDAAKANLDRALQGAEVAIRDAGGKVEFLPPEARQAYEWMRGIDAQIQDSPEKILEFPQFTAPAYRQIRERSPEIDNSAFNRYNPDAAMPTAPVVPSQSAPAVPQAPPLAAPVAAPAPANIEGGVMVPPPLTDPEQQQTLTTPPPARGGSWRDIFGRLF